MNKYLKISVFTLLVLSLVLLIFKRNIYVISIERDIYIVTSICLSLSPSLIEYSPTAWADTSALHITAGMGYLNTLRVLLEHGSDVNINKNGVFPIHIAANHGDPDIIMLLLKFGANSNCVSTKDNTSPLHWVVSGYRLADGYFWEYEEKRNKSINVLLDAGAEVNAIDSLGNSPLHDAAKYGYLNAVKMLVQNGADVKMKNNKGFTALEMALSEKANPKNRTNTNMYDEIISQLKATS